MNVSKEEIPLGSMFETVGGEPSQRWLFVGQTRSGKTWSLVYALEHWIPAHDEYIVICPTWKAQPIYYHMKKILNVSHIMEDYDINLVEALIYKQKMRTKWSVDKSICLILDDVLACKGLKGLDSTGILEQIYALGRHHKISCFTLLQKITAVSTTVRNNASLVMFKSVNDYEIRTAFNTSGFGNLFTFKNTLADIWSVDRRPFIFRVQDSTFYCGWDTKISTKSDFDYLYDRPADGEGVAQGEDSDKALISSSAEADTTLNVSIDEDKTAHETHDLTDEANATAAEPTVLSEAPPPPPSPLPSEAFDSGAGVFPSQTGKP